MGEGFGLAIRVDAGALVVEEGSARGEMAVGEDGEGGDGGAVVVGDDEELGGGVEGEVGGVFAAGGLAVEEVELAVAGVDGEGFDGAGVIFEFGGGDGV